MNNNRLESVRNAVKNLYEKNDSTKAEWADWLYPNHVLVVANEARYLAEKYHANAELAEICALLHDIADTIAERSDPEHESKSLTLAREILEANEYSEDEVELVVNDALRFHSCHDGNQPKSLEGKVLSTADSYAHLETDFYFYAMYMFKGRMSFDEAKGWALAKLERDYNNKIFFDDERKAWTHSYDTFKERFSR